MTKIKLVGFHSLIKRNFNYKSLIANITFKLASTKEGLGGSQQLKVRGPKLLIIFTNSTFKQCNSSMELMSFIPID